MNISTIKQNFKLITIGIAIASISASSTPAYGEESDDDYIPEIGWSSRITSMGLDREDNFVHAPTWGTKIYTVNSGICSAAVHSGMLDPKEGGEITIKLIKGKKFYTGSKKNNVKSKDHTATDMSFVFVGE